MKRSYIDLAVGLFVVAGFSCFVYISLQFGEFSVFSVQKSYALHAEFQNVSGLKRGATVEMAGVTIGKISDIRLGEQDQAQVTIQIDRNVQITDDAIASVKTQGIIGDKYIKISQGGSETLLKDEDRIEETESALDLEELVSKYIFGDV